MSIRFDDLAVELKTTIGFLTNLAETLNDETANSEAPLNLPIAAKANLTNEEAATLRIEFKNRQSAVTSTTPQLNPGPIRNAGDIQPMETPNIPAPRSQEEDPTADELETVHNNLEQTIAAQETQQQQLFEGELSRIKHEEFRVGALKAIYGKTANAEGFIAASNALAGAENIRSAEWLKQRAAMLAGKKGADFLPSYPNAAESSTQIPEAPESIAQPNLNILKRLKKS